MKRTLLVALLAIGLVVLLAAGITQLFSLRQQTGDVYPPYSTLRADPMGAKAFSEALAEMPGLHIERSFREPPRGQDAPATIFVAGVTKRHLSDERGTFLPRIAHGSRAVFTF